MRIIWSTRFKKDIKKYQHDARKMEALGKVIGLLEAGGHLPVEYSPHMLVGEYAGHMECHILNDYLLIWLDHRTGDITLTRLGSHSELF